MGVLEFLVPFYPINTARVVFSSDSKMDPLNLYPITRHILSPRPWCPFIKYTLPSFIVFRAKKNIYFLTVYLLWIMMHHIGAGFLFWFVLKKKEDLSCCIPNVSCIYHPFYKCAQSLYNHLKKGMKSLFYAVMCN